MRNTPGTAGGPGAGCKKSKNRSEISFFFRKKNKNYLKKYFRTREIPQSESKAEDGEKKKKKKKE